MFIVYYFVVVSSTNKYVTTQSETTHHPAVSTSIATIFSTTTRTSEYTLFEVHNYNYNVSTCKVESIQNNTVQLQCSSHMYICVDQCICDPVVSQTGDISLAGQFNTLLVTFIC